MKRQTTGGNSSVQQVRSRILNNALALFSFASFPVLIASLARIKELGWQPFMLQAIFAALLIWGATLWRRSIPFQVRGALFIGSLFLLGVAGFWSTGLVGGGILTFFIVSVMTTVLFGGRWGWLLFAAIMISMIITTLAILSGVLIYPFDVGTYAVSPRALLFTLVVVFSALAILTASLGRFHAYLLTSSAESNDRATKLAKEVSERQSAEAALKESEEKFRLIVENILDVYFETGLDGTIHYCTPSCFNYSGYRQDELIGRSATILYDNPEDRQLLLAPLQKEGKVRALELVFRRKDGSLYDVEFNADIMLDDRGEPSGMHGTIRDVTVPKSAKEQMQRVQKMEAVVVMAGGVAHDLNNIISAIVGYPDLMLMTLPAESELREPLTAIRESGHRAAEVIADLLTVSKGAATTHQLQNLSALIDQYLHSPEHGKMVQLFPQITCQTGDETRNTVISCSAVHVKKCLMNLINNAAEAIVGDGVITVGTAIEEVDEAFGMKHGIKRGRYAVLSVEDSGPGIAQRDLEHIFEPFYTKKYLGRSGSGLGLAIVWNTMQNHSGTVTVKSSSKGSNFRLHFPLQSGTAVAEKPPASLPQEALGKQETILVVDDDAAVRDVADRILTSHGYAVAQASSGELALAHLKENKVDVIVLDMLMEPGISGRQTYEQILHFSPRQRALISSGYSETEDIEATLQLGAGEFIKKPYTKEQLCLAVRQVLDQ